MRTLHVQCAIDSVPRRPTAIVSPVYCVSKLFPWNFNEPFSCRRVSRLQPHHRRAHDPHSKALSSTRKRRLIERRTLQLYSSANWSKRRTTREILRMSCSRNLGMYACRQSRTGPENAVRTLALSYTCRTTQSSLLQAAQSRGKFLPLSCGGSFGCCIDFSRMCWGTRLAASHCP